jgi:hypothetical protein
MQHFRDTGRFPRDRRILPLSDQPRRFRPPAIPPAPNEPELDDFHVGVRRLRESGWKFLGLEQQEDGIVCLFARA